MGVYEEVSQHWKPNSIAISDPIDGEITFENLEEAVSKISSWLKKKGIKRGEVLCVQSPKQPLVLKIILGCLASGVVVLPLNDQYGYQQSLFYLKDSNARVFISNLQGEDQVSLPCEHITLAQFVRELGVTAPAQSTVPVLGAELGMLLYTSGTTGTPKGAMLSHNNIISTIKGLHQCWHWTANDRLLHALPIFHVHGLFVAQMGALYAGATSVWMRHFDAKAVGDLIHKHQITIFMGVPTMYFRLLSTLNRDSLLSVRLFTSGSAPLPVSVHHRFSERFGHVILERYGMTEVGIVLSNPYIGERRVGSVGFPIGETQIRIVSTRTGQDCSIDEVGEIWISGPSVISGYYQREKESKRSIENGWLKSGDLGVQDSDGYISIVGRAKDLIISGGFNIYPRDIERKLLQCSFVSEVAVVGLADEEWGEVVVAVLKSTPIIEEELSLVLKELAPYQTPRLWAMVDDFPRNAMGKVQKARIREWLKENPVQLFKIVGVPRS
jgi:malonyl-CoA/methylmalonyl-CoA synthetase